MQKNLSFLVYSLLYLSVFVYPGCSRYEFNGQPMQAGLALTFDDDRIDNWYAFLPYFDSAGIRATFYISNYLELNRDRIHKLQILREHGHEIAYHGTSHLDLLNYVVMWHHSIPEMLQKEIEPALARMQRDEFNPVSFSFPYGSHSGEIDQALKKYFTSVRALNHTRDVTLSIAGKGDYCLYGLGLDKSSGKKEEQWQQLLREAKRKNGCAILVAHNINCREEPSISRERLQNIAALAKELGLKYYTVSALSR